MIDTDKYKIADDVVWIWNDSSDAYDEEKEEWVSGVEHANWQLWEYKECPAEKGGYRIYRGGEDDERTHEPHRQILPNIPQIKWDKDMQVIMDLPLILAEVKRLREKLFEAELWVNNESYTFENDMKELNDYAEAMEE
jgi:hypothetical protein|tara:strand:+ start:12171 stop:12584 length:414 start_codon:yes stop_codon:yes gene_type:complete